MGKRDDEEREGKSSSSTVGKGVGGRLVDAEDRAEGEMQRLMGESERKESEWRFFEGRRNRSDL